MPICTSVGADIKTCQAKGKIVTLSLGGAGGSVGFQSDDQGVALAGQIWNMFLGGTSATRPFGWAVAGFVWTSKLRRTSYPTLRPPLDLPWTDLSRAGPVWGSGWPSLSSLPLWCCVRLSELWLGTGSSSTQFAMDSNL